MDPRITNYIEHVRSICATRLSPNSTVKLVREAAADLVVEPPALDEEHLIAPLDGYGRNLLHRDPDSGFTVVAMIWPPGSGGEPHDHGTWGIAAVSEGMIRITSFDREDSGSVPGHARLTERSWIDAGPGAVACVLPPHDEYHQVRNLTDERAISIHTYGADIRYCNAYDVEQQTTEVQYPTWTRRPALVGLGSAPSE